MEPRKSFSELTKAEQRKRIKKFNNEHIMSEAEKKRLEAEDKIDPKYILYLD